MHQLKVPHVCIDVLVCPRRVVPRMSDLRPEEVSDLFLTVQQVGKVLGKAFDAEALTISCQVRLREV